MSDAKISALPAAAAWQTRAALAAWQMRPAIQTMILHAPARAWIMEA